MAPGVLPGDFELGSLQSRAAARAVLENEVADDERNRFRVFVETIGKWTDPDQKTGKLPLTELIRLQGDVFDRETRAMDSQSPDRRQDILDAQQRR